MIGFVIWCLAGCLFLGFGIAAWRAEKPTGFWSNVRMGEVNDIRGYNHAMGKLWCVSGVIFMILGIPLLADQDALILLVSVGGSLIWVIAVMLVYELGIMRKYRKE